MGLLVEMELERLGEFELFQQRIEKVGELVGVGFAREMRGAFLRQRIAERWRSGKD